MRFIISTTGTSIAQGVRPVANERDHARYVNEIKKRCTDIKATGKERFLSLISAETNSLERLRVRADDQVVLLHSDTLDGKLCANEVAELLRTDLGIANPVLEPVDGLQVTDATRFRRDGIGSLFKRLDEYAVLAGDEGEVLLNITGGFKSVVPYVTLYGMLRGQRVVYLFERSEELISLPPAPLAFDWGRLASASKALTRAEAAMTESEFYEQIPDLGDGDREWYGSMLEREDGMLYPSAFGEMVYAALDAAAHASVFITREAEQLFRSASGVEKEQYSFILSRITNPLLRKQHWHRVSNSDLVYWKPGSTNERAGYFLKGGDVYVCELGQHSYSGRNRRDFPVADFRRVYLPDHGIPANEEELVQSWRHRLDQAEAERRAADELVEEANAKLNEAGRQREELNAELAQLRAAASTLTADLAQVRVALVAAEAQLAEYRRPWWQRIFRFD